MPKHIYVERRTRQRQEEAPVEQTGHEKRVEDERHQAIQDEVAELQEATDEVLEHIDEVLVSSVGIVAVEAA